MFPAGFGVMVRQEGDTHLVNLVGELDLGSSDALESLLVEIAGSTVVVDLGELTFIDSSGMGALERAGQVIRRQGHAFAVRNARANVRRSFELIGLAHLLES